MFEITHKEKNTRARTGIIHTDHGDILTPTFMPVGTQATVKTLDVNDLNTIGASIILSNTYHLHLRPGEALIDDVGGLHKFMNWNKPILTDSGGFQVLSLGSQMNKNEHTKLVEIDEEGVTFRSHLDGSTHRFTPEIAIDIQHKLGADIIMAFDECTPDSADLAYAKDALARTDRWLERSIIEHKKDSKHHGYRQFLFGIVQGATHRALREQSAKFVAGTDVDGIAIGGESIGYNMPATRDILDWVYPFLPEKKPHYAMGVGFFPTDLFDVVERGIDMFDCVAPTRIARNGMLYVKDKTKKHRINILNTQYTKDLNPIDAECDCFTCQMHTRAYLHHLFKADELLAYRLATIHNLRFLLKLMENIRAAIQNDSFLQLKHEWSV